MRQNAGGLGLGWGWPDPRSGSRTLAPASNVAVPWWSLAPASPQDLSRVWTLVDLILGIQLKPSLPRIYSLRRNKHICAIHPQSPCPRTKQMALAAFPFPCRCFPMEKLWNMQHLSSVLQFCISLPFCVFKKGQVLFTCALWGPS